MNIQCRPFVFFWRIINLHLSCIWNAFHVKFEVILNRLHSFMNNWMLSTCWTSKFHEIVDVCSIWQNWQTNSKHVLGMKINEGNNKSSWKLSGAGHLFIFWTRQVLRGKISALIDPLWIFCVITFYINSQLFWNKISNLIGKVYRFARPWKQHKDIEVD